MNLGEILQVKPILFILIFLAATTIAIWLGSIYWVYQDIFTRTNNVMMQIGSIVIAAVLPFTGLFVYILIRPSLTIEESRYQHLEEKLFIRQLKEIRTCPKCKKNVEKEFINCPYCRTKLRDTCPKCDKLVERDFTICPYCGYTLKEKPTAVNTPTSPHASQYASTKSSPNTPPSAKKPERPSLKPKAKQLP
jgi:RNA polymerase subunit RPABC4/transcription elongation factor Spt4